MKEQNPEKSNKIVTSRVKAKNKSLVTVILSSCHNFNAYILSGEHIWAKQSENFKTLMCFAMDQEVSPRV